MIRLAFEYGPLLVWAGLLRTFVRPLRFGRAGNCALGLFLLLLSQKFLIYKIFGGDSFVPDLPERLVNVTGWAYSSCLLLFGFTLAGGCGAALVRTFRRLRGLPPPVLRLRAVRAALLAAAALAVLIAGFGVWEGVRVPRVKEIPLALDRLPPAFDGFRLVHLSDLHCSPAARRARTEGIVARVNALHPDLVCITGDLVDGSPEQRLDDLAPLKDLVAPVGVFGCAGNHEYYHDYALWQPVYASLGIQMLDNAHRVIERGGAKLVLAGVTDPAAETNHRRVMEGPSVELAFALAPAGACRILMQHRPHNVASNRAQHVDLQLSGHTHGGAILGFNCLVKAMNQGHVCGLYDYDDLKLYVTPGTGQWAGFPLRLGVPAEITVFTLHVRPESLNAHAPFVSSRPLCYN